MELSRFLTEELKHIDSQIIESSLLHLRPLVKHYEMLDLIQLLRHSACDHIHYFESKDHQEKWLGLGLSKKFSFDEARTFINNPESIGALFVQGQFEGNADQYDYILPEWLFWEKKGKVTLWIFPHYAEQSFSPSANLLSPNVWESFLAPWKTYEESPEHDEWTAMIREAHECFKQNICEKIVLSRKKIFSYEDEMDLLKLFSDLYEANLDSSHFSYFVQKKLGEAYMSFTPEKLFSLKDRSLQTLSLAGSSPRGKDAAEDDALMQELIRSDKLVHEQSSVTTEIEKVLEILCENVRVSGLQVMKLPYIFHRQKDLEGTLKPSFDALHVLQSMHPTPAVGGTPREKAREEILKIEKSKRGLYAAPFGVLSPNFSECAVGIRSAYICDNVMTVYGGAGITAGSIAEDEWNETGLKMRPFLKVINQTGI